MTKIAKKKKTFVETTNILVMKLVNES